MAAARDLDALFDQIKPILDRPQGATFNEIMELYGISRSGNHFRLKAFIDAGRVHMMDYGRSAAYFLTREAADNRIAVLREEAYQAKLKRNSSWKERKMFLGAVQGENFLASPKSGMSKEEFMRIEPTIPENVKITRASPFIDRRYYVDDMPMLGGFLTEWQDLRAAR